MRLFDGTDLFKAMEGDKLIHVDTVKQRAIQKLVMEGDKLIHVDTIKQRASQKLVIYEQHLLPP
jgi:hypothetical protein